MDLSLLYSDHKEVIYADAKEGKRYVLTFDKVIDLENLLKGLKVGESILKNDKYAISRACAVVNATLQVSSEESPNAKMKPLWHIYIESYADYLKYCIPKILRGDRTWVDNILEGKAEQERVAYRDENFVVVSHPSWKGDLEDLYLLLFVTRKDLHSIRDLTAKHLSLLRGMRKVVRKMEKKYAFEKGILRSYFRYPPSTWALHLHISNINSAKEYECTVERSHALHNVITNITLSSKYYQSVSLEYSR